jgi:outer membrane protein OmpA-like peptidoglycan-associated protein
MVEVEERATTEEVAMEEVKYEVGTTIELTNVYFDFDKADLLPESQKELNKLADLLFDYPYMEIEVGGHTDNKGKADYNLRLSDARAQAVVAYLLHKKVDKDRLKFKGYGSSLPLKDNDTEEGQKANRRVEFKITKN